MSIVPCLGWHLAYRWLKARRTFRIANMLRPTLIGLLALLPLTFAPAVAPVPQSPDLAKLVSEEAQKVGDSSAEVIWQKVRAVADLSRRLEGQDLAAAAERLLSEEANLSPAGRVFAVGLRLQASDPDAVKMAETLRPLLRSKEPEIALAAAQLCADANFRALGNEARDGLLTDLSKLAEDGAKPPALRLESAIAMHTLGSGEHRKNAWRLMNGFLGSQDPELRQQGALALARTHAEITGALRDELRRMASVPGALGRVADAYIETARTEEHWSTTLRRQAELYEAKPDTAKQIDGEDPAQVFMTVMNVIQKGHLEGDKVKTEDLLDAALNGMLHRMDEHSTYMDSKEFGRFEQDLEGAYGGIGAYVQSDPLDTLFTITHPIYSGPAYKAGLVSEDKIVRVDDWPTLGETSEAVIKRLKGRPGTTVKLYIWKRGMEPAKIDRPTEDMAVEIVRASIEIPQVQSQMLPGKVGLISLLSFSRVASQEVRQALLGLQEQGMESLILDLRNNPGGLLDEAVAVASPFLSKGKVVVKTESRVDPSESKSTRAAPLIPMDMPMAVLINRFSASASEIVSGALQDHERATLVGQRSFGKGSVQKLLTVPGLFDDESSDENRNGRHDNWEQLTRDWNKNGEFDFAPHIKLTISRYLLPSGRSIHREVDKDGNITSKGGVDPDIKVDARSYEAWRLEEMVRLQTSKKIRDYVDQHFAANKDLFTSLAENDQRDPSRYPQFEEFMTSLATPLAADDVRQLVRIDVRKRVQDLRGKEFPGGDFVEDAQLQEAIRVVLEKLGKTPADIEEYKATIPPTPRGRLQIARVERGSLQESIDQINAARKGDGKLSQELLERLQELLQASLAGTRH